MKREVKEQRLHDLVERYIAYLAAGKDIAPADRTIELIAHSPESPIAMAISARLPELNAAGVTVRAIFASTMPEASMATWLAQASWVQWARDKRLLEIHEQLILGATRCWTGDAMRRGATKTDLFESLNEGSAELARLGRQAFDKLTVFASVIRPRRVTASLNAAPRDYVPASTAPFDAVLPTPDFALEPRPLVTRH
jgi:hypothetical protein